MSMPMFAILIGTAVTGCSKAGVLETGYDYRRLNSTEVQRRAFYADAYSLEAIRAQNDPTGGIPRGPSPRGPRR